MVQLATRAKAGAARARWTGRRISQLRARACFRKVQFQCGLVVNSCARATADADGDGSDFWNDFASACLLCRQSAGYGCCRGAVNKGPGGVSGRGKENMGGGGGGAGACHGGGGAGGAHRTFNGVNKCARHGQRCSFRGNIGDGAPECTRAGSYSQRGKDYGDPKLGRLTLGGGGGAGNSYSPSSYDDNSGGVGGGIVILMSETSDVHVDKGRVMANGCQGDPSSSTQSSKYRRWYTVNTQVCCSPHPARAVRRLPGDACAWRWCMAVVAGEGGGAPCVHGKGNTCVHVCVAVVRVRACACVRVHAREVAYGEPRHGGNNAARRPPATAQPCGKPSQRTPASPHPLLVTFFFHTGRTAAAAAAVAARFCSWRPRAKPCSETSGLWPLAGRAGPTQDGRGATTRRTRTAAQASPKSPTHPPTHPC